VNGAQSKCHKIDRILGKQERKKELTEDGKLNMPRGKGAKGQEKGPEPHPPIFPLLFGHCQSGVSDENFDDAHPTMPVYWGDRNGI